MIRFLFPWVVFFNTLSFYLEMYSSHCTPKHLNTDVSACVPDPPACDGGAAVSQYSVEMAEEEGDSQQEVFQGADPYCTVRQLLPGTAYLFWVKAHNAAGVGSYQSTGWLEL